MNEANPIQSCKQ